MLRVNGLRRVFRQADAFLVTNLVNVRYLTGFTGSSGYVVVTPDENYFITDFRYAEQSEREVKGFDILIENRRGPAVIAGLCKKIGVKTLAFEDTVSYGFAAELGKGGFDIRALSGTVEKLRASKDALELAAISRAVHRAEEAFREMKARIRAGAVERSLALRLEERLKRQGCRSIPFEIIVASGPNSSLPHARPTGRRLKPGDLVTFDWGGEADGYYSDMTRTFLLHGPEMTRKKKIYQTLLDAQREGFSALSPGKGLREVDSSARDVIKNAGYAKYFGHGLGHGVGLEVHEEPRLSPTGKGKLGDGMVVTVEPGVYVPGLGGVRIEDMAVITADGARRLTRLSRRLEILK
jgi:Xaa-Pro aminopeptidase